MESFNLNQETKPSVFVYDVWLLFLTFVLLVIGLLMVASASMVISGQHYGTPFYFLSRQLIYVLIGVFAATLVLRIPTVFWEKAGIYLFFLSLFLLVLVFIPGIGREVNGSTRWISFAGINLEISEFAKFCTIIYLAGYLTRHEEAIRQKSSGVVRPVVLLGVICFLLLLEPDFGAIAVVVLAALAMMFLAGARLWQFVLLALLITLVLTVLAIVAPYRLARLTSFLDPWARPFDSGYQLTQSLIAFGRGGFWGVGLGNSMQKLFYLPEAHTDFLFAILAEEFGVVGGMTVLGLFSLLIARILYIGKMSCSLKNSFSAYLVYGFGVYFALQTIVNIGVNVGILPTKGLTLPFISYGGSSMLLNCVIIAILLRIYHEMQFKKFNAIRLYK